MIGHVASAGEGSGRVVLRLSCGAIPHDTAVEAAARIAQAFESEIEGLFVEDFQLLDLTEYTFTQEISLSGKSSRSLSMEAVEGEFLAAFRAAQKRMQAVAKRFQARSYATRVRDDPLTALARACARAGPWNVIVVSEPFTGRGGKSLGDILTSVRDATGLVTVGPRSRRIAGPVLVVAEDPERLLSMMRTAERLTAASSGQERIVVMLVGDDTDYLEWLEGQARLILAHGPEPRFILAPPARGEPAVVAEALRRLSAGFVISRFGGLAVPEDDLSPLAAALECPLFLVR